MSRIESLRTHRVRPERAGPIGDAVSKLERDVRRRQRALKGIGGAWSEVVPEDLGRRCELVGLRIGVLTVRVQDGADRFELDRFLRSGGLGSLISASPATLRRVRIVP